VKLKCSHLENDAPVARIPRASSERKITMFAGELISGQKILHHMQLIERRAIQIIAEYARTPDDKTKRIQGRPSELPVSLYESNSYMFSFHGSFDILHFIFNSRPSRLIDS
jgi:hypothetical protein